MKLCWRDPHMNTPSGSASWTVERRYWSVCDPVVWAEKHLCIPTQHTALGHWYYGGRRAALVYSEIFQVWNSSRYTYYINHVNFAVGRQVLIPRELIFLKKRKFVGEHIFVVRSTAGVGRGCRPGFTYFRYVIWFARWDGFCCESGLRRRRLRNSRLAALHRNGVSIIPSPTIRMSVWVWMARQRWVHPRNNDGGHLLLIKWLRTACTGW